MSTIDKPQDRASSVPHAAGNWPSAITTGLVTQGSIGLTEPVVSGETVYHIERRPDEKGRCVIVCSSAGIQQDILPPPYSARSRVHEYGGGSYCVSAGLVFFVNDADQDIYMLRAGDSTQPRRITAMTDCRFADLVHDRIRNRLIAVRERHAEHVRNELVSIDIAAGTITELVTGADFYASPRLDPSATMLCWQQWDLPAMPWDGNTLCIAGIDAGGILSHQRVIAGNSGISVFQPMWMNRHQLCYVADPDGWWQLYYYDFERRQETCLTSGRREFGLPQWIFRQSTWCALDDHHILCSYRSADSEIPGNRLLLLDIQTAQQHELESDWLEHDQLVSDGNRIAFIAASGTTFPQLVAGTLYPATAVLETQVLQTACKLPVADGYYATARRLCLSNRHGQAVYANYYAPTNPDIAAQLNSVDEDGEAPPPPLIVICHGGPTGQSSVALDPKKLFWTSRGYALLDVDYSGSTGYGRAYRQRLDGCWGELDVEDCCDAALYAVSQGLADPERLVIRGSSAGGLTVLAALTFHDVFTAGACYYGISDLASLSLDTHKFESGYNDTLVGPYPEAEALYRARSPLHHAGQLHAPVIFFQGRQDTVVPPAQTAMMVDALRENGVTTAVQYFEGEQHGFRQAATIEACLHNELAFYRHVFGIVEGDASDFHGDIMLYEDASG